MSSRRKKGHGGSHENHERWLITYSDLITLLMIFFVIMYAMSQIDQSKFSALTVSLNKALHASNQVQLKDMGTSGLVSKRPESDTKKPPTKAEQKQQQEQEQKKEDEQKKLDNLLKQVQLYIAKNDLAGKINVIDTAKGVQITLSSAALFDSGSADLKPGATRILTGMAPFLKIVPNQVAIEGHTDSNPINNAKFPSNWELSSQRAINVLHSFENAGVPHPRLHAEGFADTVPLSPNDTEQHRAENRRVNLIILREYPRDSISPLDQVKQGQ